MQALTRSRVSVSTPTHAPNKPAQSVLFGIRPQVIIGTNQVRFHDICDRDSVGPYQGCFIQYFLFI